MPAEDGDIDSFIRQQKAKLANERQALNNISEANMASLNIGQYELQRKELDRERQQDYKRYRETQDLRATSVTNSIRPNPAVDGNSRYSYQEEKKRLAEERRREYNELLQAKSQAGPKRQEKEIDEPRIIPFDRADQDKQKLRLMEEERQREYNMVKARLEEKRGRREPTPQDKVGLPVGEYERRKQKERDQREYRDSLQRQQEENRRLMLTQQLGIPAENVPRILGKDKQQAPLQPRREPPPKEDHNYRPDRNDYQPQPQQQYSRGPPSREHRGLTPDRGQREQRVVQFQTPRKDASPPRREPYSPPPQQRLRSPPPPQQQQEQHQYQYPPHVQDEQADQRDKMLSEYDQIWKEQHGGYNPSPYYNQASFRQAVPSFNQGRPTGGQRRQWGEPQNVNPPSYQDNRPRPTERRKEKEDLEYERQWEARHPGQDTSPRFRDDRLHMAQPEQGYQGFWSRKQQEDEEYYKIWDDTHQGAPYSQAQPKMPAQTQEPYFDTEKLIRDTVQKRRDEEEAQRRANQAPPQRGPPRGAPTLRGRQDSQESEYTKLWEQQHKQQAPMRDTSRATRSPPKFDTEALISKVTKERLEDEYRKLWEERQALDASKRGDPSNSSRLHFSDSRQNIDYKIAEAKRDAEEYHKRWDQQHQKDEPDPVGPVKLAEKKHFPGANHHISSSEYENNQQKLRKERQKDMQEFFKKSQSPSRVEYNEDAPNNGSFRNSADYRKKLAEARNQEYNDYLKKKEARNDRSWQFPQTAQEESVFPLGSYEKRHQKYEEERKEDMQYYLQASRGSAASRRRNTPQEKPTEQPADQASSDSDIKTIPLGGQDDYKQKLREERQKEYNEFLKQGKQQKKNQQKEKEGEVQEEATLPLGGYEEQKKKLREERHNELIEYQKSKVQNALDSSRQASKPGAVLIRDDGREARLKKMEEDRNREYNEFLKQKPSITTPERFGIHKAPDEAEDFGLFHSLGQEDKRRKLIKGQENKLNMKGENVVDLTPRRGYHPNSLREQTDDHKASALLNNQSDAAKLQDMDDHFLPPIDHERSFLVQRNAKKFEDIDIKPYSLERMKERNNEYREFLAKKNEKDQHRFDDKKHPQYNQAPADTGVYATLPGLRYSNSAQNREKMEERNKEYNELMRQKRQRGAGPAGAPPTAPKQGWGTPTPSYEQMLEKKREQEAGFRRANDPGFQSDRNSKETELRIKELDRDLAAKRADQPKFGILEDPYWLSPRRSNAGQYVVVDPYSGTKYFRDEVENTAPTAYNGEKNDPYSVARGSPIAHAASRRPPNQTDGQYFGTSLPLGGNTQSEEQRKKAEYARELRQQMEADKNARKIERREGALVNNTGNTLYNPTVSTRTPRHDTSVKPYHTEIYGQLQELDKISPRNKRRPAPGGIGGLNLGRQETNSGGIGGYGGGYNPSSGADLGLDLSILQRPTLSTLDPPAGLQYQPSTFITANAVPALNNSVDEAYNFYAGMNPLDPNQTAPAAPPPGRGRGGDDVPSLNLSGFGGDDQGAHSRVRFKDNRTPAIGMEFPTDDDRKVEKKQNVNAYREELERQIQERNAKKRREKEEQERPPAPSRYDLKMEEEARHYDPFGKGGGGAPMRDPDGNVISDLRQIRHDNNDPNSQRSRQRDYSPRGYGGGGGGFGGGYGGFSEPAPAAGNTSRAANSYRDDLIGPPPTQTTADGDPSFARGGHGIFGMPKTEGEKNQADKYKMDLKRQIEEKKQEELRKKEKERQEEEREQRILEEQRQRIQREYEEEQRKAKAKEEEARMKNEEMMRLAEDKKKELERQRKEAEEKRQQELREQRERELRERQAEEERNRPKSPPIPALRGKGQEETRAQKIASPPVPATRTRTAEPEPQPQPQPHSTRRDPPRAQSADVLNQLADMRAQLRKERQRVQHMLEDQEDDVEIYDPRQVHRPPPAPIVSHKPEIDVFETAMNRNAVAVRRTPGDRANPQAVEDFNALKHKNDSDSRKQFRQMFPNEPDSNDALETQQLALLRQQEERLNNMKDRRALEDTSALRLGRDIRSSSSQLHSNSAFVDVNGVADFPDDFEDMPKRNESARAARRRARAPSSPRVDRYATPDFNSRQTFGSQTSLNVDKLAKKNEDRLRRLRDMQGDDLSLYDPDDVLDRFMTKQGHNRRTYDDDFDSRSESFTPAFVTPVT